MNNELWDDIVSEEYIGMLIDGLIMSIKHLSKKEKENE